MILLATQEIGLTMPNSWVYSNSDTDIEHDIIFFNYKEQD